MRFHYTYKSFPHSPKATARSKALGVLTCFPSLLVFAFFWYGFIYNFLWALCDLPDGLSMGLSFLSLIGFAFLVRWLKKAANRKIDQIAMEDLLNLQRAQMRTPQ